MPNKTLVIWIIVLAFAVYLLGCLVGVAYM